MKLREAHVSSEAGTLPELEAFAPNYITQLELPLTTVRARQATDDSLRAIATDLGVSPSVLVKIEEGRLSHDGVSRHLCLQGFVGHGDKLGQRAVVFALQLMVERLKSIDLSSQCLIGRGLTEYEVKIVKNLSEPFQKVESEVKS